MEYKEFIKALKAELCSRLGEEFEISVNDVYKPNSQKLDSLNIMKKGEIITPNIYINPVYEKFIEYECDIQEVADYIIELREEMLAGCTEEMLKKLDITDKIHDFEAIKNRVTLRMMNRSLNEKLLDRLVNIPFLDLAVTFAIRAESESMISGIIRISREMMEKWGISSEYLMETALDNLKAEGGFMIGRLIDLMREMYGDDQFILSEIDNMETGDKTLYVISEKSMSNGSAAIFMNDYLAGFSEVIGGDYLIIPSSVNELICMKDNPDLDYRSIRCIIRQVNRSAVPEDEILGNSLYRYSVSENNVSIVA